MSTVVPEPNVLTFQQIEIGQSWEIERTFSANDCDEFARLSGDFSPLHVDSEYARTTEFESRVVHGMFLASLFSQLVGMWLPGKHALYLGQDLSFRRPVLVGDTVRAYSKVVAKNAATRTISLTTEIRSLDGKVVVSGTAKVKLRDTASIASPAPPIIAEHRNSKERVVLVTGASRGAGAEIARRLGSKHMAVAVNYLRSAEAAASVVNAIRNADGTAISVQADVRDGDAVKQMVKAVVTEFGRIDCVVNCAIAGLQQSVFIEMDWDRFQQQMETQLKGTMQVLQAVYPVMKTNGGGAVVNVLSQVVGGAPPARMADYVSVKHALYGLSKALASEWAPDHIRVNTVSPGLMETDLTQHYSDRIFKLEANRTLLGRIAQPGDVAGAVAYLLSEDAAFMTGVNLFLTGGQVM
jgi:3-oxoacyl-[acyl-carrier protein] reductase